MAKKRSIKRKQQEDPQKTLAIRIFLDTGFKDYLAARSLLNSGQPELVLPGAILASTCVEKHMKAILVVFNRLAPSEHLNKSILNSIKNCDPNLYSSLNESFLDFLRKIYGLRYPDSVKKGFTVLAVARQILAELDYTVHTIQTKFSFQQGDRPLVLSYAACTDNKHPLLMKDNHVLLGIDKTKFIEVETPAYAMLVNTKEELLEVTYTIMEVNNGDFMKPGLTEAQQDSGEVSYLFSYEAVKA